MVYFEALTPNCGQFAGSVKVWLGRHFNPDVIEVAR
jgi:hypothetical protein